MNIVWCTVCKKRKKKVTEGSRESHRFSAWFQLKGKKMRRYQRGSCQWIDLNFGGNKIIIKNFREKSLEHWEGKLIVYDC